jgi:hypothetical protein
MDLANSMLKNLNQDGVGPQPILPEYLEQFFERCIARDNFDGIAHLTNYCNQNEVEIGEWNLSKFRSAINYYMNVNFNLSKVMIFTKFYTSFYKARAASILNSVSEADLDGKAMAKATHAIFTRHDNLVDMKALFNYLVDFTGSEKMIDPLTKEDALWSIVDTFTRD